jgi:hypothetical protein
MQVERLAGDHRSRHVLQKCCNMPLEGDRRGGREGYLVELRKEG